MGIEYGRQRASDPWDLRVPVPDTGSAPPRPPAGVRRRTDRSGWHWLLLLPIVASMLSPVYNNMEPEFGGMPFFYWFPLSLNLGAGACMLTVHLATRRGR